MLIDTHAHLTWDDFKPDLQEVVGRAKKAGITQVINVGADLESSKKAAELECPGIKCYSSIGLHPEEGINLINDVSIHQSIEKLKQIYQNSSGKVVAVGECGLDYFKHDGQITDEEKKAQKALFQAQIDLAKKLNLPLIIHCRDSWEDIFDFNFSGISGVFHSFTGSTIDAKKVLDLGFYLGLSCIVTYPKNEQLRQIIKDAPVERLLTETDCPFLPPQHQRGQRNEPGNVVEVVKIIAQMKNLPYGKVAEITFQNAKELFKLS